MGGRSGISAVVLDLDGTLLDTERATRGILEEFLARYGKTVDREKEDSRLGLMFRESAAAIVKDYDLPITPQQYAEDIMPLYKSRWQQAKALPGAHRLIGHLHKHNIPLGLASNSIREHVEIKVSYHKGWKSQFNVILGGDDVEHGKPSPDIYLEAAKRLGVDPSSCLILEDSPVGVRAGRDSGAKVVAVPSLLNQMRRYSSADSIIHSLLDFHPENWDLPPFKDWVGNVLPIEPLNIRDLKSGPASIFSVATAAGGACEAIPDQISGIFVGWANQETDELSCKVVARIGWDFSGDSPKRLVEARILGRDGSCTVQLNITLVGYIGNLPNEANLAEAMTITGADESIARDSLDLSPFQVSKAACRF